MTDVVERFNAAITARDLDALVALMTDDHRFIDGGGKVTDGKAACREAWRAFFAAVPDYQNHFESIAVVGDRVVAIGHSTCSDPKLTGRALWTAIVHDGLVAEWRVHDDTPAQRALLGI